ncbi:hypothetical protein BDP27DRAFT_1372988 [Rhodocollybia butyracea]|uniref:DUF6533 domain-containing protein n=1 Tax=Rhodocollybia butyracea TaxID=206335 RepID=A0A9P5P7Y9_9AGAR|nr:hypothetical protein BDP27DRAFT_1372988 [Rhodocollybia butyracea]
MSDSSSDQAIAKEIIINLQFDRLLDNYVALSALVIWFQDFLLTLPTEVRSIWSNQLTGCSVLFILSRYSFLLFAVIRPVVIIAGYMSSTSCRDLEFTEHVISSVACAATKLLSILRVYALFGQKRSLFIVLCLFIIADIAVDFLSWFLITITTSQGTFDEPFSPCFGTGGNLEFEILNIVSPLLQLAFDSIIFILTLARTARHVMQSRKFGFRSIAEVVLRDGTLYFFTIFIIASIQVTITLDSLLSGSIMSNTAAHVTLVVSAFLGVLPNLLINRFVLNLRAYSNRTIQHSVNGPSGTTALPLIYDYEKGSVISLVPMQRGGGGR